MSFLVAAPELLESAAQDLAGIRSALSQATGVAAGPTTGVLAAGADEVSAAISQLFGSYGTEFQALSAQAAAFHDEFVGLMSAGAGAYASVESTTSQALLSSIGGVPGAAAAPGVLGTFQSLVSNTTANLQSLNSALVANPAPLLNQLLANQSAYGQTIATGFANAVQNLPAGLANVPANIQGALQALATANPGAVLQGIVNNQIGYGQLIGSSLQTAGYHIVTGFEALPASFQAANQAFAVGDITGGLKLIGGGFLNPFLSGFSSVTGADGIITVTPTGALGDLLPIFSIPGQMAQNFTNLLPAGSIPAQMSQNFTNVIKTLTDTSVTSQVGIVNDPNGPFGLGVGIDAHMGLPLALAIEAIGGPVNGLNALGSSVQTFASALQSGNALGAATAVFNAPAAFADGFLNGQTTLPLSLSVDLGGGAVFPTTLNVPLSGILVPAAPYGAVVDGSSLFGPGVFLNSTVTGTPLGGILGGLLNYLPADLASVIGGPAAPVFPPMGL